MHKNEGKKYLLQHISFSPIITNKYVSMPVVSPFSISVLYVVGLEISGSVQSIKWMAISALDGNLLIYLHNQIYHVYLCNHHIQRKKKKRKPHTYIAYKTKNINISTPFTKHTQLYLSLHIL